MNSKPILCLYKKKEDDYLSAMIKGNKYIMSYCYSNIEDVKIIIDNFLVKI